MCLLIPVFESENVHVVQSVFNVGDFKHTKIQQNESYEDNTSEIELMEPFAKRIPDEIISKKIYIDENGIYHYSVPHCSKCNSRNVTKHDTNKKKLKFSNGTERTILVKKYRCKDCGKNSQVEFNGEFKDNKRISTKVIDVVRDINALRHISLGDVVEIIKSTLGITVSREYIRKSQIITNKLTWRNPNIKSSDYIAYDAQWIPVDEGWSYLHVLSDVKKNEIIALEMTMDEEKSTVKRFLKDNLRIGGAKGMVTDLRPDYHTIMKELNIKHQFCTRHFDRLLSRKIQKDLKRKETLIKAKILTENPDIKDSRLKDKVESLMKEYIEEYYSYKHEIMEVFEIEDYDEAIRYIQALLQKDHGYPENLGKYIHNDFSKYFSSLLLYKHRDFKGKIPPTNNISEQKIHFCATKAEKRKYRTALGFFNHIVCRVNKAINS